MAADQSKSSSRQVSSKPALQPQFGAPVGAAIDLVAEDDLQE